MNYSAILSPRNTIQTLNYLACLGQVITFYIDIFYTFLIIEVFNSYFSSH